MRFLHRPKAALGATALTATLLLASCGGSDSASGDTLTLYNAQHEELVQAMVDGFTKETGSKVELRNGGDFELANQIIQEGSASPADVFLTENSPAMSLVDSRDGFAKVDQATLDSVAPQYRSTDGDWIGFAARATVFAYNKNLTPAAEMPGSIMDLAKPEWKDKIGIAPAGADFQAIVSAVVQLKGEAAAEEWLKGLKANAKIYQGNTAIMKAVDVGEIRGGVIYHYYWYKDRAESGANSSNTELHYFGQKDPGAFVSVSGAGVVKASKKQAQAQQLVKYLDSVNGQRILAESDAMEYPIANGAPANSKLKPLGELDAPTVDANALNGPKVTELMQKAGLL